MDSPATTLVIADLAHLLAEAEARIDRLECDLATYRDMVSVLLERLHARSGCPN